jgi:hypothetical protein
VSAAFVACPAPGQAGLDTPSFGAAVIIEHRTADSHGRKHLLDSADDSVAVFGTHSSDWTRSRSAAFEPPNQRARSERQ